MSWKKTYSSVTDGVAIDNQNAFPLPPQHNDRLLAIMINPPTKFCGVICTMTIRMSGRGKIWYCPNSQYVNRTYHLNYSCKVTDALSPPLILNSCPRKKPTNCMPGTKVFTRPYDFLIVRPDAPGDELKIEITLSPLQKNESLIQISSQMVTNLIKTENL